MNGAVVIRDCIIKGRMVIDGASSVTITNCTVHPGGSIWIGATAAYPPSYDPEKHKLRDE